MCLFFVRKRDSLLVTKGSYALIFVLHCKEKLVCGLVLGVEYMRGHSHTANAVQRTTQHRNSTARVSHSGTLFFFTEATSAPNMVLRLGKGLVWLVLSLVVPSRVLFLGDHFLMKHIFKKIEGRIHFVFVL